MASWVGITGTEDLTLLKRLLPGGSATELVLNAWNGGVARGRLAAPARAHAGLGRRRVALASRFFRWEPRR